MDLCSCGRITSSTRLLILMICVNLRPSAVPFLCRVRWISRNPDLFRNIRADLHPFAVGFLKVTALAPANFPLGSPPVRRHIPPTRQGSSTIMEPRFSDARNTPSEPDAGHAAVGSRNRQQFPFPRPCLIRTAFFMIFCTFHIHSSSSLLTDHSALLPLPENFKLNTSKL